MLIPGDYLINWPGNFSTAVYGFPLLLFPNKIWQLFYHIWARFPTKWNYASNHWQSSSCLVLTFRLCSSLDLDSAPYSSLSISFLNICCLVQSTNILVVAAMLHILAKPIYNIRHRFAKHAGRSPLTGKLVKGQQSTTVRDHMLVCNTQVCPEDFKIIGTDGNNNLSLKVKESLFIMKERPDLNIQGKSIPLTLF